MMSFYGCQNRVEQSSTPVVPRDSTDPRPPCLSNLLQLVVQVLYVQQRIPTRSNCAWFPLALALNDPRLWNCN